MVQSPAIFLNTFLYTVCIRISAQPRISAHLEYAPILKAEKVNKRPASNKHPPHPTFCCSSLQSIVLFKKFGSFQYVLSDHPTQSQNFMLLTTYLRGEVMLSKTA